MHIPLEIHFLSDWHIASGIGDGHWADALLIRDADGLPHIPGRALKGALREGARRLSLCENTSYLTQAVQYFWGSASTVEENNTAGVLRVSAAHLPQSVYTALKNIDDKENLIRDLTILRQHTALDDKGMVVKHSLHSIECGMAGMSMEANIHIPVHSHIQDAEAWIRDYMRAVCAATKSIGGNRARGLGRCRISLIKDTKPAALPPAPPQDLFCQGA